MAILTKEFINVIAQAIYDKNGFNIYVVDVRGISSMADYYVIAEGNVDRHVKAIAKYVIDEADQVGAKPIHVEGMSIGDWLVIDFCDVIVHILVPEYRQKYALEELWTEGRIVDLEINLTPKRDLII